METLTGTPAIVMSENSIAGRVAKEYQDKGSIGNRVEYAVKQSRNLRKAMIKDEFALTAGTAATAGAAALVYKSKDAQNAIANVGKKILANDTVKKYVEKAKPYANKALTWVKSNKKAEAAIGVVTAAGLAITNLVSNSISNKSVYEAGKIDQEYTDKAKIQKLIG